MVDENILSIFFKKGRPQISIDIWQMLYEKYAEDINNLEVLIGRDLSEWKTQA
jgi:hypothetical protein